jgi:hypothetical protein
MGRNCRFAMIPEAVRQLKLRGRKVRIVLVRLSSTEYNASACTRNGPCPDTTPRSDQIIKMSGSSNRGIRNGRATRSRAIEPRWRVVQMATTIQKETNPRLIIDNNIESPY